jgi:hypothetical protein
MTTLVQKPGVILPFFSGQSSFTSSSTSGSNSLHNWFSKLTSTNDPSKGISPWALYQERNRINGLSKLTDNWDTFGSARPNQAAIQYALVQIEQLFQLATSTGRPWIEPHITASESGEVVFEWWSNDHKLTVYVGSVSAEFIQVWGLDIVNEMSDGAIKSNNFQNLWKWLHT